MLLLYIPFLVLVIVYVLIREVQDDRERECNRLQV